MDITSRSQNKNDDFGLIVALQFIDIEDMAAVFPVRIGHVAYFIVGFLTVVNDFFSLIYQSILNQMS